jgi:hypothetical protein
MCIFSFVLVIIDVATHDVHLKLLRIRHRCLYNYFPSYGVKAVWNRWSLLAKVNSRSIKALGSGLATVSQ